MKEIRLTRGYTALVDDEDYEALARFHWFATSPKAGKNVYAVRSAYGQRPATIYMHRVILGARKGEHVDHIEAPGKVIDNRRSNLRIATPSQNAANQRKRPSKSRFKGVVWSQAAGKWMARVTVKAKGVYLGLFRNEEDAARAYNEGAREAFGEFARLNEVPDA